MFKKLINMILLIVALSIIEISSARAWTQPYFISNHPQVEISHLNQGSNIVISIIMDEEIPKPVAIANMTDYTGNETPDWNGFIHGLNSNLGLVFSQNDNTWQMIITRTQDFEYLNMANLATEYYFQLNAVDGVSPYVSIRVKNIFDNSPTVRQMNERCEVPEYEDPGFNSNCLFEVFDIDGMENNEISFILDSFTSETFEFQETSKNNSYAAYTLIIKRTLNYDSEIILMFNAEVSDIADNKNPFNVIVYVKNVPSRPPVWIRPFASDRLPEMSVKSFEILAIDGDRGIGTEICYKLEFNEGKDYSNFIKIPDPKIGTMNVVEIDRDEQNNEIFSFEIIAYKCNNESSLISSSAVIIVDDVNNKFPEISFNEDKNVIEIWESEISTLFESNELSVHDKDLGSHATYTMNLLPEIFSEAFSIIPLSGYQLQNFTISVVKPNLIDYEQENWRNFTLTIKSQESETIEQHSREKEFRVILKNWNDELPKFLSPDYNFSVYETIGIDSFIGTVVAEDLDEDDELIYYLNGRINDLIKINSQSGLISTNIPNAFDYERQTEVLFQAFVKDTLQTRDEPLHMAFVQVRIDVLDVNDTPPQLILPQGVLKITENSRTWEAAIQAYDPDTTADLEFFIDWENSRVSGSNTEEKFYKNSLIIVKSDNSEDNTNAVGLLQVNPQFEYEIDYEKYHFMYIVIGVVDKKTEINSNTTFATLTIEIEDVNDNSPEFWPESTLTINRRVIEEAEEGIFVGSIMARDVDGPGNNEIIFSMIEKDSLTPQDWLKIDSYTGEITVNINKTIDCDAPNKRDTLDYIVNLSDGLFDVQGEISIFITDINNKIPQIDEFNSTISLYENATDVEITTVMAHDDDRDNPHNVLRFSINYIITADFFEINSSTGELRVRNLSEDHQMDRDNGITEHLIYVNVDDNEGLGIFYRVSTTVRLILKDCNDNAPEMPDELLLSSINENLMENVIISSNFYAPDKDEGLNAEVSYAIEKIENVEIYGDFLPNDFLILFKIENINQTHARILTGKNLKGYSGKWMITISATDKGSESEAGVSLRSEKAYEIEIEPFNFNAPLIVYPRDGEVIRIDFNNLTLNSLLLLLDGSILPYLEAVDTDVGLFGEISFIIESEDGDDAFFNVIEVNKKQSELVVKQNVEERAYTISVTAVDGGNRRSNKIDNIKLIFVNVTSDPIFNSKEWATDFTENEEGLSEIRIIPEAEDPKNIGNLYEIYYYIDESYNPNDAKFFKLNKFTRELTLSQPLDRETIDHHRIKIIASNLVDFNPPSTQDYEKSSLYVNITVNDVNDNAPKFDYQKYTVGVSERDNLGKILLTFHAFDPDLNDRVTYHVLTDTMTVSSDSLREFMETAFELNSNLGILTLNFQVQEFMSGYFSFKIQARDLVNHTDESDVKIYTVAEKHRITFVFGNTTEEVLSVDLQGLSELFSSAYSAECINDDILKHQLENGNVDESKTDYRAHFLRNEEAVEKEEIYSRSIDVNFITELTSKLLLEKSLVLYTLPIDRAVELTDGNVLEVSLAITSGVLGLLLIIMIAFHIHQSRNFHRQLNAHSQPTFDPSNYNRQALPNTNLYANERSNPVLNADLHSDTQSIISSDSDDFAGLENSHIFDISSKIDNTPKNPLGKGISDASFA